MTSSRTWLQSAADFNHCKPLRYARHFVTKRDFIHRHSLHMAYLKQPTKYISKRSSQQAGEDLFLNSEMPKKIRACPSINKSTEWHPLVPDYSPPLILTIANRCSFCSLQYDLSPPVGPLGCAEIKAAQYVCNIEEQLTNQNKMPTFYKRYVDDSLSQYNARCSSCLHFSLNIEWNPSFH